MNVSFYEEQLEREVSVQLYVLWREIREREEEEEEEEENERERDTIIVLNVEGKLQSLNNIAEIVCDES